MNQDVRINVDFFSHHKTLRLKRKLGHEGIVSLLSLFCYTGKTRADGTLQGMDAEDIAAASNWAGEPQEYVSTLCEIGFLERCEEGVYSIHDWQDHNQWASNANDRSDSARLSKLAQVNPEKAKEYREAGRVGITTKEYSLSAKQRNASERSANAVQDAGETLAPSPAPLPSPAPAQDAIAKDNTPPVGVSVSEGKPKRERKPRTASSLPFADDFATFWETYPRKVAKPNAEKAWTKLVKAGELPDMDTLLAAVANQADAKDWRTDQTFCPHPATWLNGKRWEDSVTPARGVDTSWHQYRDWSTRYLTRRRAIHPDDTPEPTQDIVDAGAQWLGEWICPDGFSEPQIKAGIVWLLEKPRRCQHVKHLGDLGLYSQGVGGNLGTWCVNGAMGMQMPADPFNTGPMDGGPPRDIA